MGTGFYAWAEHFSQICNISFFIIWIRWQNDCSVSHQNRTFWWSQPTLGQFALQKLDLHIETLDKLFINARLRGTKGKQVRTLFNLAIINRVPAHGVLVVVDASRHSIGNFWLDSCICGSRPPPVSFAWFVQNCTSIRCWNTQSSAFNEIMCQKLIEQANYVYSPNWVECSLIDLFIDHAQLSLLGVNKTVTFLSIFWVPLFGVLSPSKSSEPTTEHWSKNMLIIFAQVAQLNFGMMLLF